MKISLLLLSLFSFSAFGGVKVMCTTSHHKFLLSAKTPSDIAVTFNNETVKADGILDHGEIDFVARFKSLGEMTLFAKVGQSSSENYVYVQNKRFSVLCL